MRVLLERVCVLEQGVDGRREDQSEVVARVFTKLDLNVSLELVAAHSSTADDVLVAVVQRSPRLGFL